MKPQRISLVLLIVLALLLAGCAAKPAPTAKAPECPTAAPCPEPTTAAIDGRDTFYFLAANNSDPFYVPGVKGLKDAAASVGMKAEFVGPMDLSLAAQVKTFEEINANPNAAGVMLYAIDHNALDPLVMEAQGKGIPVVIGAADSAMKHRAAFVGYDNSVLGVQAAEWAAKLVKGQGVIGTIGVVTANNVTERQTAFADYLKANYSGITVVERATYDGSAEGGAKVLDQYLVAHPDLTLLWWADGLSGQMAQPWKERQGTGAKAMFLATDMPDATLQAVKDGVFVGSVGQDTYTEAYWCVLALNELRQGRRVPDSLYLSAILVDKANVDQFLVKK